MPTPPATLSEDSGTPSVRILHLEDNVLDAELLQARLEEAGLSCRMTVVDSREGYESALAGGEFDLIISDFSLPSFDGGAALAIARERCPEVPFLFVSGTIGEESAVKALLSGATDYLLKSRLARLGPAVERALREAEQKREERRLLEALRRSEAKYRQIVETTEDGIWSIDADGGTVFVNPRMASMLGRSPEEMVGTHPLDHVPEQERESAEQYFAFQRLGRREVFELRFRRADGSELWVTVATTPMREEGRCVGGLLMVTDITEKKSLEGQFLQAQKMEAVGRLAGGVAHDFNNLLTAILGNCGFALDALPSDHPAHKDILQVKETAQRAASLTQQLLAFSRKQVFEPEILDLNVIVANMEKLLRRLIGEDIRLHLDLAEDLPRVEADPSQVEQVIMNLAVNARDAMPRGGTLTLATATARMEDAPGFLPSEDRPGPCALLSISDTGCGMDPATLARVFEPFFTTKEVGKGTGLGLSTAHEIIKKSSGLIDVESKVGDGTTFRVRLPGVEAPPSTVDKESLDSSLLQGRETILVVEDEEVIREILRRMLTQFGYSVLVAGRVEEALRLYRERGDSIDLVVTDVIMPDMNGLEFAQEVERLRPGAKVLFLSGYTDAIIAKTGVLEQGVHFLGKPFTAEELIGKVREVLDSPPSAPSAV